MPAMLTINLPHIDRPEPPAKAIVSDRRLYLTRDEQTVVEDGDARAAFLLAATGGSISGDNVVRLSLAVVEGRVVQRGPDEAKQAAPEGDKQDEPDATTQASPDADKQSAPQSDKSDKTKRERK